MDNLPMQSENVNGSIVVVGQSDNASQLIMTAVEVKRQVQLIQQVMRDVMQEGTHYGKVPGCGDKPVLLKAGAEKIAMTFRLSPTFEIVKTELPDGHREYEIKCLIAHATTNQFLGQGVGSCSTMEKKYRYRWETGKDGKKLRVENPDIADVYNTVLKMAKKRAQVDATLTVTACSDIFEQDLEEIDPSNYQDEQKKHPVQQPTRMQESPAKQGTTGGNGSVISEAQGKRFYAIAKNAGLSDDDMKFHLQSEYGIASTRAILKTDYEALCKWAESAGEAGAK